MFSKIKVRPAILAISLGLVITLIIIASGVVELLRAIVSAEEVTVDIVAVLAAVLAFGGGVTTCVGSIAGKLVESEEKGN